MSAPNNDAAGPPAPTSGVLSSMEPDRLQPRVYLLRPFPMCIHGRCERAQDFRKMRYKKNCTLTLTSLRMAVKGKPSLQHGVLVCRTRRYELRAVTKVCLRTGRVLEARQRHLFISTSPSSYTSVDRRLRIYSSVCPSFKRQFAHSWHSWD